MNFTVYDLILLGIFVVFTSIFLITRRKNLKREGLLFLYKTKLGIKIIDRIGNKYKKTLSVLSYVSIGLGFLLMFTMLYLFGKMVWTYIFDSAVVKLVKIPPITPLLPYLPQIFKLSYLPPFYFIYWIVIIAIVAISHEFSHGIFAVHKKVKLKSTGFGFFPFFLPIFLAAFVEIDEKNMEKKRIRSQMAILSAGTFANVLVAILFFVILILFFSFAYTPSGVVFDAYTYSAVGMATISSINGVNVNNATYSEIATLSNETYLSEIEANNTKYLATESLISQQTGKSGYLMLYEDAPAIRANLSSTIIKVNGVNVRNVTALGEELMKYSPGDTIIITGLVDDAYMDYMITLEKDPENNSLPYLGIGFLKSTSSGVISGVVHTLSSFKNSNIYYTTKFEAAEFIYNLLWWLVMMSISVALMNMLPVGIFDGGRFFFLAMLGITKDEKKSKKIFAAMTYLFLLLLAVMMIFWGISFFR